MSASTNNQSKAFFNFVTTGSGWVNRIRSITLRKGSALALTFVALRGEADENGKTESTTVELYVRGSEAKAQIQSLIDNGYKADDKVWASFEIGDLRPDLDDKTGLPQYFTRKDGSHLVVLRGNLLRINYLKINGEYVVTSKPAESEAPADESTPASTDATVDAPATVTESADVPASEEAVA